MRLARRITDVYQQRGFSGIATQTVKKFEHWHRKLTFRPHIIEKTLSGHTFRVAINNLFARGWVEGRPQWPELEWIKENLLAEGDYVVDCGANIGFTSIFFAHFVGPAGRVVAFEPFPPNAADIRQNISLNGLRNVRVVEAAVGSRTGNVNLLAMSNGVVVGNEMNTSIVVPLVCLDDAITDGMPTLLKIDVEGHELEVLNGARRILNHRPKLDIEVHPCFQSDPLTCCRRIFELLGNLDYELYVQPKVDAAIESFTSTEDLLSHLAKQKVFHIFARPGIAQPNRRCNLNL